MMTQGGVVALVVVLLGAVGTSYGVAVMSVDLGSEWMKIAVVSPGVPMEIVLNPESKRKTSVAVSIKDGERKFGSDAMAVCTKAPKYCYTHLLDLLGKKVDNPIVKLYKARFPHHNIQESQRGTVEFKLESGQVFSVEELLGMVFAHAKKQAEDFTEQKIKDGVIVVPVYFNQAERLALLSAASLGGLNVLQLMSEPLAASLNYGMFRRKEINGTTRHLMLYDMGAQDTTATIVGFQVVKLKEKGFTETHPQAQILGVGYDRTLGGTEITFRLREYLADQFDELKKTKTKVRTVPRAMGKLLKEAERVKLILSANTECFAQIENVMEDIDFKIPMTRDKLYELMADTWDRVVGPVKTALDTAGMSLENIDQIILVGGGSRVPKVQELLSDFTKKELGKNLNTDESAAMGAVYRAADISSGFKVKKFITKEAVVFPLDVTFERELEDTPGEFKKVRRTLFSRMNPFPQKKIMTFNKHIKDFSFFVNYQDVDYLGSTEVSYLGTQNVSSALVKGVAAALDKNKEIESKGVKAHFTLDDSGILTCTQVESVFEQTISVAEQEAAEAAEEAAEKEKDDTWSKLGDTISQFFTSEDDKKEEGGKEDKSEAGKDEASSKDKKKLKEEKKKKEKEEKERKKKEEKEKKEKEAKKKEPKKPKVETTKEELTFTQERHDLPEWTEEIMKISRDKLEVLDKADRDRVAQETALNELQSFVYDLQDKLYQEEYEAASTEQERERMREACSAVSDWLDEEAGPETELKELTSRMKKLTDISSALFARVREHKERPEVLEQLEKSIANSREFLDKSRNLTGEDGLFKEKELENMEKKIVEVETWRDEKVAEQKEHPLSEMPKLTVGMIFPKIADIDNEVKYMVQKAKMVKAEKERAKRLKEAEDKKAEEAAKKAAKKKKKESAAEGEGEAEEKAAAEDDTATTEENEDQNGSTTTSSPTDSPDEKSDTPLEESESPAAVDAEGDAAAAPETSSDDAGVHSDSNDSEDTAANGEHTEL